ncbi:12654_t:CDS:1 [Funneliformis caledonium]|uniref:12654_t:CDS:1 n=1 Tax=Funneliformis caledonium TaxID=1117310 RepID=A0A9N8V775_9GLOM|nr:12654_t:CDS:1 [Funneliformis caledonium]
MTRSKLFGSLPEISYYIIQLLQDDLKSLYSCALVNRLLCQIAIPMLWENPFSIRRREENPCSFLDTYFLFLNTDDRLKFKKYGITINPSVKKPLFNYPRFIKTLDTFRAEMHSVNWINNLDIPIPSPTKAHPYPYHDPLCMKQPSTIFHSKIHSENTSLKIKVNLLDAGKAMKFTCTSLFKIFINNNASIRELIMKSSSFCGFFLSEICEMILRNSKFISNLETLTFCFFKHPRFNFQYFLASLSSLTCSIKHFKISFFIDRYEGSLTDIITTQKQISSLAYYCIPINACLLDSFKYCVNTLTTMKFVNCNFENVPSFDVLQYFTKLQSLCFDNCGGLDNQAFQPLLDNPASLKVKSLQLGGKISEYSFLLQKIGPHVEDLSVELGFGDIERCDKAFKNIITYCRKIKFLHVAYTNNMKIPKMCKLITHINKYLKYLSFEVLFGVDDDCSETSSSLLTGLGTALPSSLEYLNLDLVIDPMDLKTFFDSCKHIVGLNKLLVRNRHYESIDETFSIIKEFVNEAKIKEFAYEIENYVKVEDPDYLNLEKLVLDVQPKRYSDLIMRIPGFDCKN